MHNGSHILWVVLLVTAFDLCWQLFKVAVVSLWWLLITLCPLLIDIVGRLAVWIRRKM